MATVYDELQDEVKSYINFTWKDTDKENQINGFILFAKRYLTDIAGKDINFNEDLFAKQLLFDCVLYLDSRAFPDFETNYNSALNQLRIAYEAQDTQSV